MIWYFICIYITKRTLDDYLEIHSQKYFSYSLRSLMKYFSIQHSKRNFLSLCGHVISTIYIFNPGIHYNGYKYNNSKIPR